ncbi:conserved exported hypothetical protein [Rhodospirillaceae bacterium LM-1]|nr:conserved exported hypothetical protein [Rhodospirillaceae bacterium LM-1]
MIHRTVRGMFQGVGAMALLALIALPLFVWNLSKGPISVAFLTPYVEDAFSAKDGSYAVQLDDTVLALDENRLLDIRAKGVRLIGSNGQALANIPEIGITLSPKAMVRGVLGLRRVSILRPVLRLTRGQDGKLDLSFAGQEQAADPNLAEPLPSQGALIDTLMEELMAPLSPDRTFGMLTSVIIRQADLTLVDKQNGAVWHAPEVDLLVMRDDKGLTGKGEASILLESGAARLDLGLGFEKDASQLELGFGFASLAPAQLAHLMPELQLLTAIDLPLAGQVKSRIDTSQGLLSRIDFDMTGGEGKFVLPKPLSGEIPVQSLNLKGSVTDGGRRFKLDELALNLGGPTATLGGVVDGLGGDMIIQGEANVRDMPTDRLREFWPAGLADNARDWIMANLSRGIAKDTTARFTLQGSDQSGFKLTSFSGGGDVEGVLVDYLAPMTKAENVAARMSFSPNSFHLDLKDGYVYGLKLKNGRLDFTGLDAEDQFLDVKLEIDGPLTDALKLIEGKPLGFASALGIDPAQASGEAGVQLHIFIPLLKALTFDMVQVDAKARIENLTMPKVLMGLDITGGSADLKVDTKGLDLTGKVRLAGMAADLEWRENFSKSAPFRSRYRLKGNADQAGREALGLTMQPFTSDWMDGPVGIDALATLQSGGKGEAQIKADLTGARLNLIPAGHVKAVGEKAAADVLLTFGRKGLTAVPRIQMVGDKINMLGSVQFASEGGALKRVGFSRLHAGRTEAEGSLSMEANGRILVEARGESLDASLLLDDDGLPPDRKAPPMSVQANLKRLWINEDGGLDNAQVSMTRTDGLWRNLTAEGLTAGKPFRLSITPEGPNRRRLFAVSSDAGAAISGLGILDNVKNGKLEISGVYDDTKPETPLEGLARMQDFDVVRAPVLARILTVAGITGIVDALRGQGIGFARLEAPFVLSRGSLYLREARASGAAIGVTAKGNIDLSKDVFDLEGTLVPAYAVNSLLGNIPLVGNIFSGGEKGGGIFAFTYSLKGPASDPNVSVNPLAALAPGFLRNLFGIFDKGPTQAPPAEASKP